MIGTPFPWPKEWTVTPTASREAGTDPRGNPLPPIDVDLPPCLVAPGTGQDPEDWSAAVENTATLYAFQPLQLGNRDHVTIPEGQFMAGKWIVAGRPEEWPAGTVIRLERA